MIILVRQIVFLLMTWKESTDGFIDNCGPFSKHTFIRLKISDSGNVSIGIDVVETLPEKMV